MRIGKSLFLGSAAAIAAVPGAQAADLPVKAKPVEYVKVCSLYGAGFFYIPGTDKCIKIGGYMREQWDIHGGGNGFAYMDTTNATWTRGATNDSSFRTRSVITFDVREQSSYGTIRGYTAVGGDLTTPTSGQNLFFNRGFVQFAGFTAGKAVSFFDFINLHSYGYSDVRPQLGSTDPTGIDVFAYTAQFGNGISGTISAEDNCALNSAGSGATTGGRGCKVVNTSVAGSLAPGVATFQAQGYRVPDIVVALRADQAWGSAQLMAAYHPVAADYYGTTASPAGEQNNGHPGDAAGWAAGGGFLLKDVLGMKGDLFGVQAQYAVGAVAYLTALGTGPLAGFSGGDNGLGNSIAFGSLVDGVYTSGAAAKDCSLVAGGVSGVTCGSGIELSTGWTVGGVYQHQWNPQWKTSVYGGYVSVSYNDTAANYICNGSFNPGWVRGTASTLGTTISAGGSAASSVTGCDPNLSFWSVGTRTQWNPNSNLDLGFDVVWNRLNTANSGVYNSGTTSYGGRPAGAYNISDYDVITAAIRAQYNFLP